MIRRDILTTLAFFRDLPAGPVAELAAHADEQTLQAGDVIVRQHDPAQYLFFLRSGSVQFLLRFEGVEELLVGRSVEPGMLIGWSAFRPPFRYTASVRCDGPCSVVRLPRDRVETLIDTNPTFGYALLRRVALVLADRIAEARGLLVEPPWLVRRLRDRLQAP